MTAEQKKLVRDNSRAILAAVDVRAQLDKKNGAQCTSPELETIAGLARALLEMVGNPGSPWSSGPI